MKSKASIKGHPLHPILVSFPIALLTGAFLLDLLALWTNELSYSQAAGYALTGGLIFAVLAAIPGMIDYIYVVPPESSAQRRTVKHALLNGTAMIFFLIALLLKSKEMMSDAAVIGIEGAGVALLGIAGWLGGTLIVRNQIGVDHRYANAGKWQEVFINTTESRIELKGQEGLEVGQMRLLRINDKRIVLARTEQGFSAFEDRCTHRGGSLADGVLICGTVQCPWHGSQFDVQTGLVKAGPGTTPIKVYQLSAETGSIWLQL